RDRHPGIHAFLDKVLDGPGGPHADTVTQRDLVTTHAIQAGGDTRGLTRINLPLIGTAEHTGDRAPHLDAVLLGCRDHRLEARKTFLDRTIDVGVAEGLGGAGEDGDVLYAGREGVLKPAQVGDQGAVLHAGLRADAPHHLLRILHGRDHLG